jgi:protein phosphatase/serine/threonine-protein phosphatase Stp1
MEAMTVTHFRSSAMTDPGPRRSHNEDAYVDRPDIGLWAVADGAGGHDSGEVAAAMLRDALQAIPTGLLEPELVSEVQARIELVHRELREEAKRRGPSVMLASTVVALLAGDDHFTCLWAGDSRVYLLRDGGLRQLTRDHSLVQELLDAGAISAEQAEHHPHANVITRAVGADLDNFALDKVDGPLRQGDLFLLCCDGVFKTLPEAMLTALLTAPNSTSPAETLIAAALKMDASDNVTAVTIEVQSSAP